MKLGQLLSLEAGDLLSTDALKILSRLRDQAYAMPTSQLRDVLKKVGELILCNYLKSLILIR